MADMIVRSSSWRKTTQQLETEQRFMRKQRTYVFFMMWNNLCFEVAILYLL